VIIGVLGIGLNERLGTVRPFLMGLVGVGLVLAKNRPGTAIRTTVRVLTVFVAILVVARLVLEIATR
jgi:hypothetical protein